MIIKRPFCTPRAAFSVLVLTVLLTAAGLLPFTRPSAVSAQANDVTMTAAPAYGGNFKYGEWLPVWVELDNQGNDLEGDVRIDIATSQGTLVFDAPVSLPTGARKLVPLYVLPNNFSRELTVNLVEKDKVVASQKITVRPQANISYFIGLLAPERGALALLNGVRFPGQTRPMVLVDLTVSEIPERSEALRSFNLLVFNDTDTSKLTPEQASALAGWVQQGGRLVIGGGAGAPQTLAGLPAEMLAFELQGSAEITAGSLGELAAFAGQELSTSNNTIVVARSAPRQGSGTLSGGELRTLVSADGVPLVLEWNWGQGFLNFIAVDLAGIPFNGWPGTQAFWEALVGTTGSYPDNMPFDMSARQYRDQSLTYPLSNIPSLDLPSIQGLTILLIIYILMIGPVNYLVLRRMGRLHLAWVTIPVLTLAFAGGAFGIGYAMRGNDLILNRIALVEIYPDGNAGVTSYMGLFSPRMQSYEVTIEGESLISPMGGYDQGMWGGGPVNSTGGQMVFVQDRPSRVRGLSVNQWAMQSFVAEGTWTDFGKITGNLTLEGDVLKGTVRNDSRYPITDVVVTMQSRYVRLGDMAPGEEKTVDMGLASQQSDRFGPPLSYRIFQEQYADQAMPRDVEQKTNILSSVLENTPWTKVMSSIRPPSADGSVGEFNAVMVFGWMDQAPPEVQIANNRLTQKTTALVYTTMQYNLPESGFITLPPGMISGVITQMPPNSGTCGTSTSIQMTRGEAEFEYQVPGNLANFEVDSLKLSLWRDSGSTAPSPGLSLYNWQDKIWTNIQDPIQGTNVVQNAAPYVSDTGLVRIKMTTENDTFGCVYLDLGLDAQRVSGQGGQQ